MIKSFSENHREITDYLWKEKKPWLCKAIPIIGLQLSRFLLLFLSLAAIYVERTETKILAMKLQHFGTQIAVGTFQERDEHALRVHRCVCPPLWSFRPSAAFLLIVGNSCRACWLIMIG